MLINLINYFILGISIVIIHIVDAVQKKIVPMDIIWNVEDLDVIIQNMFQRNLYDVKT